VGIDEQMFGAEQQVPHGGAKRLRSGSQELLWVDHRFAADLIDGLEAAGMEVRS